MKLRAFLASGMLALSIAVAPVIASMLPAPAIVAAAATPNFDTEAVPAGAASSTTEPDPIIGIWQTTSSFNMAKYTFYPGGRLNTQEHWEKNEQGSAYTLKLYDGSTATAVLGVLPGEEKTLQVVYAESDWQGSVVTFTKISSTP